MGAEQDGQPFARANVNPICDRAIPVPPHTHDVVDHIVGVPRRVIGVNLSFCVVGTHGRIPPATIHVPTPTHNQAGQFSMRKKSQPMQDSNHNTSTSVTDEVVRPLH
eukprot:SAG25_NODE_5668_length_633_cov_1.076779_1_plen_106_part_10